MHRAETETDYLYSPGLRPTTISRSDRAPPPAHTATTVFAPRVSSLAILQFTRTAARHAPTPAIQFQYMKL